MDEMTKTLFFEQLTELLKIPSVKGEPTPNAPFGKETVQALEYFLNLGQKMGFRTKNLQGYCGYIEWPGQQDLPYIAMACHLDVVPAGDWETAFEPIITDGKIIARGSGDDKGPALICLYAMKKLKDSGYQPPITIRLILGLDEECGSACLHYYNQVEPQPLAAFTADADFPVIFAEKGGLNIKISGLIPSTVVRSCLAGTRPNVVPGIAEFILYEGGKYVYEGQQAHASTPELGKNAVSHGIVSLQKKNYKKGDLLDFYTKCIGLETNGYSLGISCQDEPSGELTCNIGLINYQEGVLDMTLDIRYPVTYESMPFLDKIQKTISPFGLKAEISSHSPPLYVAKDEPLLKSLLSAYEEVCGCKTEPIAIGGGTYARDLENCVAFGPMFPGEESLAHQTGEYISLDTLEKSLDIYALALQKLEENFS